MYHLILISILDKINTTIKKMIFIRKIIIMNSLIIVSFLILISMSFAQNNTCKTDNDCSDGYCKAGICKYKIVVGDVCSSYSCNKFYTIFSEKISLDVNLNNSNILKPSIIFIFLLIIINL